MRAQVNEAAEVIYDLVDPTANLIFGAVIDPRLGQEVRCEQKQGRNWLHQSANYERFRVAAP